MLLLLLPFSDSVHKKTPSSLQCHKWILNLSKVGDIPLEKWSFCNQILFCCHLLIFFDNFFLSVLVCPRNHHILLEVTVYQRVVALLAFTVLLRSYSFFSHWWCFVVC